MVDLDEKMIGDLSRLCRIHCSDEEQKALLADLKKILEHIEQLSEVDTENVEPCYHVSEEIKSVFREDEVGNLLEREKFLENAPHVAGMIKVPTVIKQD